jgi:hypothetical protein
VNIGDRVRLKDDLVVGQSYGCGPGLTLLECMYDEIEGKTCTVSCVDEDIVRLKETLYWWSPEMLTLVLCLWVDRLEAEKDLDKLLAKYFAQREVVK